MKARLALLALAAASLLVTAVALDRVVAYLDLNYSAPRGRPSERRQLVREEFSVPVETNALGFREPRLPGPKPPGTVRLVAIGDSFTQGFGVEADAAWPSLVERRLNALEPDRRHEVINLGVPGTSPRDYLATLESPGLAYAPDVVVVMVMANDVQDRWVQRQFGVTFGSGVLIEARQAALSPPPAWTSLPHRVFPALYPFLWNRLTPLREALRPQGEASAATRMPAAREEEAAAPAVADGAAEAVLRELAARFGRRGEVEARLASMTPAELDALRPVLVGSVSLQDGEATEPYMRVMALVEPRLFADAVLLPPAYDDAWDDVAGQLRRIFATARRAGAHVVLAFAPAVQQVTPAARAYLEHLGFVWDDRTLTDRTFSSRLAALAASARVPFVDLLPVLRAHRDEPLYYLHDGHWTPAGNALAAAALLGRLQAAADAARPRGGPTRS